MGITYWNNWRNPNKEFHLIEISYTKDKRGFLYVSLAIIGLGIVICINLNY